MELITVARSTLAPRGRRVHYRAGSAGLVLAGALAAVALAAPARPAFADPPPDKKMQREIRRMERMLDDMLIDSGNFLVPGRANARGIYVPGQGVIITFDASLTASSGDGWGPFRISGGHSGHSWSFWGRGDGDEDDDSADVKDDDRGDSRSRTLKREERQYARGEKELRELLVDEGPAMKSLRPGESIQVVAFMNDVRYLEDKEISHLALKIKADDLRALADKKLDEDQAMARIEKTEY